MERKPSALIIRHVENTGNGYDLDDLLTGGHGPVNEDINNSILEIHEEYRNSDFPIGTSNPASFERLRQLAAKLASEGQ